MYGKKTKAPEVNASKLMADNKIRIRVNELRQIARDRAAEGDILTMAEISRFYASVVRTPIGSIDEYSQLAEEVTIDSNGNKRVKMPSKMKACDQAERLQGYLVDKIEHQHSGSIESTGTLYINLPVVIAGPRPLKE